MAFPAIQKYTAAGQLLNQRITFVSLNQVLSAYVSIITTQAIARGYTRAGSSNGVLAALDGVSRWSAVASIRGANATTAQSWDIITAANGAQTLFAYTGSSDDQCTIACSPGGLYTLAGTPTFKPTATDECVGTTGVTVVNATASGDRLANVWIDSAHNGWRAAMFRANILAAPLICVELFDPVFVISPASFPVPVWAGVLVPASLVGGTIFGQYAANSAGGQARALISASQVIVSMGASGKSLGNSFTAENGIAQELNGSNFTLRPIGLSSVTVAARGDVGNRFDWHMNQEQLACGQLDAGKNWLYMGNNASAGIGIGILWPWDGVSAWVGA